MFSESTKSIYLNKNYKKTHSGLYKFLIIIIILSILGYFIPIIGQDYEVFSIRFGQFQFYINDIIFILISIVTVPSTIRNLKNVKIKENKIVIYIAIIYLLYQTFIIVPLSFNQQIRVAQIFRAYSARMYYIYFLFLYFCVHENMKSNDIIKYINYAAIIVFIFGIYNLYNGIFAKTTTGEMRLLAGYVVLIYGFTFIFNFFKIKTFNLNNIIVIISILGMMTINHRSGYVALGIILIISLFFAQNKIKYGFWLVLSSLIFIAFINYSESNIVYDFKSRSQVLMDPNEGNAVDRQMRWGLAFDYYLENPINGSLLSGENYANDIYLSSRWSPHNFIFETLSTEGTIGIIFIILFYFYVFKIGFRNLKKDILTYCATLYIIFYLCVSFFNTNYYSYRSVIFLLIAVFFILNQNEKINNDNKA